MTIEQSKRSAPTALPPSAELAARIRAGEDIRDDNQVDALWLRQIGLALLDDPAAIPMPQANRQALTKLALPDPKETPA